MIIPRFKLYQTDETVTIEITAKYIKLSEVEFIIENDKLYFYCHPYHLKLCLPGYLEEELVQSKYEVDEGQFTFVMKKSISGENFPNLDMIIRLMEPVNEKKKNEKVLILDDEENVFWETTADQAHKYGFAMKGLYDFHRVIDEYVDVLKVDPRIMDLSERLKLQSEDEQKKFNIDHYKADFVEEDIIIKDLIDLDCPWKSLSKSEIVFEKDELDILKDFPNKDFNLTSDQKRFCYNSLLDILFAYCYDYRTTSFEGNSESGWTIVELAASLGWLSGFSDPKSAIISAFRRSVIYPLYRNFNLSSKVLEDVKIILKLGEKAIMKCLLHIYKIFLTGDCCRYILNDIFIKDYIIFIGNWDTEEWNIIVKEVLDLKITKEDLNLNLNEIEEEFLCQLLEEQELDSDDDCCEDHEKINSLPEEVQETLHKKFQDIKINNKKVNES